MLCATTNKLCSTIKTNSAKIRPIRVLIVHGNMPYLHNWVVMPYYLLIEVFAILKMLTKYAGFCGE